MSALVCEIYCLFWFNFESTWIATWLNDIELLDYVQTNVYRVSSNLNVKILNSNLKFNFWIIINILIRVLILVRGYSCHIYPRTFVFFLSKQSTMFYLDVRSWTASQKNYGTRNHKPNNTLVSLVQIWIYDTLFLDDSPYGTTFVVQSVFG